jgi:alkaline phosphatase
MAADAAAHPWTSTLLYAYIASSALQFANRNNGSAGSRSKSIRRAPVCRRPSRTGAWWQFAQRRTEYHINTNKRRFASIPAAVLIGLLLIAVAVLGTRLTGAYGAQTLSIGKAATPAHQLELDPDTAQKPRSVVLMIADGAGLSHFAAARIHLGGPGAHLAVDRMPIIGLMTTHSAHNLVTDSAAAATAMGSGHKTHTGYIGLDLEGKPLTTFFDTARAGGKSTGIVVSGWVTDATPASFYAHIADRRRGDDIAAQFVGAGVDIMLGWGYGDFAPEADGGSRYDQRNLVTELQHQGYTFVQSQQELSAASDAARLLGLFTPNSASSPPLTTLTADALRRLERNPAGFVMMIEGSAIDDYSHERNIEATVDAVLEFDRAVATVLEFAERRKDVLVIVTSDHETGGLHIEDSSLTSTPAEMKTSWRAGIGETRHTGTPVVVYSYGPGALAFRGSYDNIDIARKISVLLN